MLTQPFQNSYRAITEIMLVVATLLLASCTSSPGNTDDHHSDTSNRDAQAGDGLDVPDSREEMGDADDDAADGPTGSCPDPCRTDQVCCVDQHGHFPRCVDGPVCVPPLQPPPDT